MTRKQTYSALMNGTSFSQYSQMATTSTPIQSSQFSSLRRTRRNCAVNETTVVVASTMANDAGSGNSPGNSVWMLSRNQLAAMLPTTITPMVATSSVRESLVTVTSLRT